MISLGYKRTGARPERKDKDLELRAISTKVHGTLDYLASGVHLAFPALLKLDDAPTAALITYLDDIGEVRNDLAAHTVAISTAPFNPTVSIHAESALESPATSRGRDGFSLFNAPGRSGA